MTPESLEAAVAQKEYLARSLGLYLRREPYTPCSLAYMKEIAKEHAVPLKQVLAARTAYAKKHPIPRGLVGRTQKQIRSYNRTHKNRTPQ